MGSASSDVPQFSTRRYEDLTVGERFGPFIERLEPASCDGLRGAIGTSRQGPSAPLGVLPMLTLRALRYALHGIVPGGVLIRQHFSANEELPISGEIEIDVWVIAQHRRASGLYTTLGFALRHAGRTSAYVEWMILAPPAVAGPER